MMKKRVFLLFIFLLFGFFSFGKVQAVTEVNDTQVTTHVTTEASGGNASAYTKITNIVNEEKTEIESSQPGQVKVEVKNGEVEIKTDPEIYPVVTASGDPDKQEVQEVGGEKLNIINEAKEFRLKILSFFKNLFSSFKNLTIWSK